MALENEGKGVRNADGFAGLSGMVSDVEDVVSRKSDANPLSSEQSQPETASEGKESESKPPPDSRRVSGGLPVVPSQTTSGKKWLIAIVVIGGLLFLISQSNNRTKGTTPSGQVGVQSTPIPAAIDSYQAPTETPVIVRPASKERQSPTVVRGKSASAKRELREDMEVANRNMVRQEKTLPVGSVDPQQQEKAFHASLARSVPDYARLNLDQKFVQWLSEKDGSSAITRGDNLNTAYKRLNAESAAYYYIIYKREVSR